MEIIESNSRILHLVSRKIQSPIILPFVGLFFLLAGFILTDSARLTILECHHTSDPKIQCVRSVVDILGNKTKQNLGSLESVEIETSNKKTYIKIGTTKEKLNLAPASKDRYPALVNKLNNFIKDPQANNITVEEDLRVKFFSGLGFYFFGIIGMYGYFYLSMPQQVNCKFDRYLDRAVIDKKYLIFNKHQEISPLSRIQEFRLKEAYRLGKHGQEDNEVYFYIVATLENGKKISVSTSSSESELSEETVKAIENFLAIANPGI